MRGAVCAALAVVMSACTVPYDPEIVRHAEPLPADAFDAVLGVFRDRYPRIADADRTAFRIQSDWLAMQHGDVPGFRRASVYRGADGRLRVVVEIYFVEMGVDGPRNSAIRGDTRAERELAIAVERALQR